MGNTLKYFLNLLVETENDAEIEETYLEGDKHITKYLDKISNIGGDFLKLTVQKFRPDKELN